MGGDSGSDDGGGDSDYRSSAMEEGLDDVKYDPSKESLADALNRQSEEVLGGGRTYRSAMGEGSGIDRWMGTQESDQHIENLNRLSKALGEDANPETGDREFIDATTNKTISVDDYEGGGSGARPGSVLDEINQPLSASVSLGSLLGSGIGKALGGPLGGYLGGKVGAVFNDTIGAPTLTLSAEDGLEITTPKEKNTTASVSSDDKTINTERYSEQGFALKDFDPDIGSGLLPADDAPKNSDGLTKYTGPAEHLVSRGLMGGYDDKAPRNLDGSIRHEGDPLPGEGNFIPDDRVVPKSVKGKFKKVKPLIPTEEIIGPRLSLQEDEEDARYISQRNARRANNSLFSGGRRGYIT
tara:strand:- start:11886 stop:12947 length:1062 start_codon:yes stop_codon:yes gene_type:complete